MLNTLKQLSKSGILFAVLVLSGCKGNGPDVSVCISKPANHGLICVDPANNVSLVPYEQSDKMVAFYPDDAQKIIEACGINGHAKEAVSTRLTFLENVAEEFIQ